MTRPQIHLSPAVSCTGSSLIDSPDPAKVRVGRVHFVSCWPTQYHVFAILSFRNFKCGAVPIETIILFFEQEAGDSSISSSAS